MNKRTNSCKVNHKFFDVIDTEEKAYWLGFITADGSIGNSSKGNSIELTLSEKDCEHLEKFRKAIELEHSSRRYKTNKNTYCQRITFNSKIMVDTLNSYGLFKDKTFSAKTFLIEKSLKHHYWRGLIDGDGSVLIRTPHGKETLRVFFCGNEDFIKEFVSYAFEITGVKIKYAVNAKSKLNYAASLNGNTALIFANELYKDASVYLERKYNNYLFGKTLGSVYLLNSLVFEQWLKDNNKEFSSFRKENKLPTYFKQIYEGKFKTTIHTINQISNITNIPIDELVRKV